MKKSEKKLFFRVFYGFRKPPKSGVFDVFWGFWCQNRGNFAPEKGAKKTRQN